MSQLTRRGMFVAVAGAGAALAVPAAAEASPREGPTSSPAADDAIVRRARVTARAGAPLPRPDAITTRARVALCRAWDHQVYLIVDDEIHGFASVDPRAFALAVGAQLAGVPLALQYWGHRTSGDGTGAFEGVLLAADVADLPTSDVVG